MTPDEALLGGKLLLASGDGWWDDALTLGKMARLIDLIPGLRLSFLLRSDYQPNLWYATATYIHYQRIGAV